LVSSESEAKATPKKRERKSARLLVDATMTKNEARTEKGVHSLSLEFRVLCSLSLSL